MEKQKEKDAKIDGEQLAVSRDIQDGNPVVSNWGSYGKPAEKEEILDEKADFTIAHGDHTVPGDLK